MLSNKRIALLVERYKKKIEARLNAIFKDDLSVDDYLIQSNSVKNDTIFWLGAWRCVYDLSKYISGEWKFKED